MTAARYFLFFLIILFLCYSFFAPYFTWRFFKKNRNAKENFGVALPPVTVIKPVAGVEEETLPNLMSFCRQDYPEYEVLFVLSEREERIVSFVEEMKTCYPEREIRWVIAEDNKGPNYKVGNLLCAVREAKHETLAISDGDMRVDSDYLKQVAPLSLEEGVGLVTCLYRGTTLHNIFSGLQALSLQTDFIPNVVFDHWLEGISYGFGSTLIISKEVLAASGGLEPVQKYLADDYQVGNRVCQSGYKVRLSPYLVDHLFSTKDLRDHFLHRLRWAITQRVCRPMGYFASLLTQGVFLALLFLLLERLSAAALALFFFVCGVRLFGFLFLNRRVIHNGELNRFLWLIPVNDVFNSFIWFLSFFVDKVHWKDRRFLVTRDGKMVEC
jgi:ceramide glucosyltransferase